MKLNDNGKPFLIILTAVALVALVSLLPLHDFSGGRISDFNLLADIMPERIDKEASSENAETTEIDIDPELIKLQNSDSLVNNEKVDNIISVRPSTNSTVNTDSVKKEDEDIPVPTAKPAIVDGEVTIEDYSPDGNGMKALRDAIRSGALARIAFLGDSYIEGDILCQDFRALMQEKYGGGGVGYMNLHSEFPGFRQSIRQSGEGWKELSVKKGAKDQYIGLSENYFMPKGKARASYTGVSKIKCADSWTSSRLLVIAPEGAEIKTHIDSDTTAWNTTVLSPSPDVQCVNVSGRTKQFKIETSTTSLIALGVWLDSDKGVSVDCMSSRGYSGLTLSKVNSQLCFQESNYINYQLIILEFGINAMSSKQTNYSVYSKGMIGVVKHLKQCYPNAGILVMGIGDRGEKKGGVVRSMTTAEKMVAAQRDVARYTGSMFWDTREAMGGNDAIVAYTSKGYANKDYVHLTHKGGGHLAELLFRAFTKAIDE